MNLMKSKLTQGASTDTFLLVIVFLLLATILSTIISCAVLDMLSGTKFNTIIEDTIDYTDKYSIDSNNRMFY